MKRFDIIFAIILTITIAWLCSRGWVGVGQEYYNAGYQRGLIVKEQQYSDMSIKCEPFISEFAKEQ